MIIPKAPFVAAGIILLGLPVGSPSWVTAPLSTYLKKKTGLEMKWCFLFVVDSEGMPQQAGRP